MPQFLEEERLNRASRFRSRKTQKLSGASFGLLLLGHVMEGEVSEGTADEQEKVDANSESSGIAAAGRAGADGG